MVLSIERIKFDGTAFIFGGLEPFVFIKIDEVDRKRLTEIMHVKHYKTIIFYDKVTLLDKNVIIRTDWGSVGRS